MKEIQKCLSFALKFILILSILNAIYQGLWHIMSANILLLSLLFMPQILRKSAKITIPSEFEFALLIFIIFTFFLKESKGIIVPISFGITMGLISLMILFILYQSNQIKKNSFLVLTFPLSFSIMFAVFLELLKFDLKLILGQTLTEGIYKISMMNLTYVTVGALISTGIGYFYIKTQSKSMKKVIKKFLQSNPEINLKKPSSEEIAELIDKGETSRIEFKSTLRVNLHTNETDKNIGYAVLKTINAFLNSKGGTLLIGISDKGEITGIEKDRFENQDKFKLHLQNLIKEKLGKKFGSLIQISIIEINKKEIAKVEIQTSNKPCFLKGEKEEEFYIRAGPSSQQLHGSDLIDYVNKHFE